jgi:hypothetical protein
MAPEIPLDRQRPAELVFDRLVAGAVAKHDSPKDDSPKDDSPKDDSDDSVAAE